VLPYCLTSGTSNNIYIPNPKWQRDEIAFLLFAFVLKRWQGSASSFWTSHFKAEVFGIKAFVPNMQIDVYTILLSKVTQFWEKHNQEQLQNRKNEDKRNKTKRIGKVVE